jgi:hypothetical protein
MSKFNPNDSSFDKLSLSYSPFPEGTHLVFISDATAYTSNGGSKAVEVEFTVHDPASKARGRVLRFQRYWTSDKAISRLVKLCRACARKVEAFDLHNEDEIRDALLDQIMVIQVRHKQETYNGKDQTKVEADNVRQATPVELARLREEYGETMLPPIEGEAAPNTNDEDDVF